ncbi:hypothetical protein CIB48_g2136 [Xylaria polymorpha]|nr:hypothetical protein CIB48_g2136 [Xylaria polymorpha]
MLKSAYKWTPQAEAEAEAEAHIAAPTSYIPQGRIPDMHRDWAGGLSRSGPELDMGPPSTIVLPGEYTSRV